MIGRYFVFSMAARRVLWGFIAGATNVCGGCGRLAGAAVFFFFPI